MTQWRQITNVKQNKTMLYDVYVLSSFTARNHYNLALV